MLPGMEKGETVWSDEVYKSMSSELSLRSDTRLSRDTRRCPRCKARLDMSWSVEGQTALLCGVCPGCKVLYVLDCQTTLHLADGVHPVLIERVENRGWGRFGLCCCAAGLFIFLVGWLISFWNRGS